MGPYCSVIIQLQFTVFFKLSFIRECFFPANVVLYTVYSGELFYMTVKVDCFREQVQGFAKGADHGEHVECRPIREFEGRAPNRVQGWSPGGCRGFADPRLKLKAFLYFDTKRGRKLRI